MTTTTVLSGGSDDLIEVGGPFIQEEFNANFSHPDAIVAFDRSDADGGALLARIRLDSDGVWRINVLSGSEYLLTPARGEDAPRDADGVPGYSDRLDLSGRVSWVVVACREADDATVHATAKAGV